MWSFLEGMPALPYLQDCSRPAVLMTVGPYKPITVEHYTSRISDVRVESEVSEDLDVAVDVTIQ